MPQLQSWQTRLDAAGQRSEMRMTGPRLKPGRVTGLRTLRPTAFLELDRVPMRLLSW